MSKKPNALKSLLRDEEGLSTVEYIIILVLIAVLGIAVWTSFGDTVRQKVQGSTEAVDTLDPSTN